MRKDEIKKDLLLGAELRIDVDPCARRPDFAGLWWQASISL
jgi:hypothetical protein